MTSANGGSAAVFSLDEIGVRRVRHYNAEERSSVRRYERTERRQKAEISKHYAEGRRQGYGARGEVQRARFTELLES